MEVDFFVGRSANPQMVPSTRPPSIKALNVVRWIKSQQEFIESLRALELCRADVFKMSPQSPIFSSINKLLQVSTYALQQLLIAQAKDPDFELPVALLLLDVIPVIAKPFVDYCTALDVKIKDLAAAMTPEILAAVESSASPQLRAAIGRIGGYDKLGVAMQAPLLQVQRYPYYCEALMKGTDDGPDDQNALLKAHEWYTKLSKQCVNVAGRVRANNKPPPAPPRAPGLYADYFYHGRVSRETVSAMFAEDGSPNGWFIVRKDRKTPGMYILSYGLNARLVHAPIRRSGSGNGEFDLGGRKFDSLAMLVKHFKVRRPGLRTSLDTFRARRADSAEEEWSDDWDDANYELGAISPEPLPTVKSGPHKTLEELSNALFDALPTDLNKS